MDEHAGKLVLNLVFAKSPPTVPKTPDGKADPDGLLCRAHIFNDVQ